MAGKPGSLAGALRRSVPGWAIVSAALSPVLLVGGYLVAGALQPASYTPVRETVSVLAGHGGTDRWIMTGALFLVGGSYLVTAAGMTSLRGAGPHPAGDRGPEQHRHRHVAGAGPRLDSTAPGLGVGRRGHDRGMACRRRRGHGSRPVILNRCGATVVTAVFIALLGWLVAETQDGSVLGLAERLTSSVQVTWPFVVAVTLRRGHAVPGAVPATAPGAGPAPAEAPVPAPRLRKRQRPRQRSRRSRSCTGWRSSRLRLPRAG